MVKTIQTYDTHFNGGRPFKVVIDGSRVVVTSQDDEDVPQGTEYKFEVEKVLVGRSPKNKMTEFSGGHGPDFDGNTLLLKLQNGVYVFIYVGVPYAFRPRKDIIYFSSPVGNNDVPYPFAVDAEHNVYLLDLKVVATSLKNTVAEALEASTLDHFEPYDVFYTANPHWQGESADSKERGFEELAVQSIENFLA